MAILIPSLWIGCGICLFAGLLFVVFGLLRKQEQVFLAFGVLCLLIGSYFIFSAQWYQAQSVGQIADIVRIEMALICLIYPAFVWFNSLFTYQKSFGRFLLVSGGAFGALFLVNLVSPYSFLYEHIELGEPIALPWGEVINHVELQTAPLAWLYYLATYTVFGWAVTRCYALWRQQHRLRAAVLTGYIVLQLLSVLHGELIDNLGLRSIYTGEFVFLALVVLVSITLAQEFRVRSLALVNSLVELQAETARRQEYEKKLKYMAYHDYLTDLPNRRALLQHVTEAISRCHETHTYGAMLLLDLDQFKIINDSLGHDVGDQLLTQVAGRLHKLLNGGNKPIRLGGDEFGILYCMLSASEAEAENTAREKARKICEAIVRPYHVAEHELGIGVSIGIVVFNGEVTDVADIVKRADMALYRAKSTGRNNIEVYAPRFKYAADQRHAIDKGLRAAIDNGEFEVHFQPQVDKDNRVVSAEVLSRWRHAELGYISPADFIPIAEESGLINLLGENILLQACRHLRHWKDNYPYAPPQLAINVSPWQLHNAGFTAMVLKTIERSAVNPVWLKLEITESTFMRDMQSVTNKIRELNQIGITFSIDDFGTGYSVLAWLKNLPLHELKIDKEFIHGLAVPGNEKLIETIIAIAKHMGLRVIAEGVETTSQYQALDAMGCRYFQGFLFSKPLPEQEFLQWLQQHATVIDASERMDV